jgi:hypothetical protein
MLASSWPASRRTRGSYRLPVFEKESPGHRTGALRFWTVLALLLAHRPSALAPQAWLASADVASGVAGSVAADSGVAASVAVVSTAAGSVAAASAAATSVAAASTAATSVAVASGVGSSIAVGSGVAGSDAVGAGAVITSSLVLIGRSLLNSRPKPAHVCDHKKWPPEMEPQEPKPPCLAIFLANAAQWPSAWNFSHSPGSGANSGSGAYYR